MALQPANSRGPAADTIDSLPRDLLGYVLQFIAARPRVLVLSRVCKKWLAIIREGLLDYGYPLRSRSAFGLFPNLTAISGVPPSDECFIHLRALSRLVSLEVVTSFAPSDFTKELDPAIYNLTSLVYLQRETLDSRCSALLRGNASSLRSLEISITMLSELRSMTGGLITFPCLTRVHMHPPVNFDYRKERLTQDLLFLHTACGVTLEHLTLGIHREYGVLEVVPDLFPSFARLCSFAIVDNRQVTRPSTDVLARVIRALPPSVTDFSLRLACLPLVYDAWLRLLSLAAPIASCFPGPTHDAPLEPATELLARCTRLQELTLVPQCLRASLIFLYSAFALSRYH